MSVPPMPYPFTRSLLIEPERRGRSSSQAASRGRSLVRKPRRDPTSVFTAYAASMTEDSQASSPYIMVQGQQTRSLSSLGDWEMAASLPSEAAVPAQTPALTETIQSTTADVEMSKEGDGVPAGQGDGVPAGPVEVITSTTEWLQPADQLPVFQLMNEEDEPTFQDIEKICPECNKTFSGLRQYCSYGCNTLAILKGLPTFEEAQPKYVFTPSTMTMHEEPTTRKRSSSLPISPAPRPDQGRRTGDWVPASSREDTCFIAESTPDEPMQNMTRVNPLEVAMGGASHVLEEPYPGLRVTGSSAKLLIRFTTIETKELLEPFETKIQATPQMIDEVVQKYYLAKSEARARMAWTLPSRRPRKAGGKETEMGTLHDRPLGSALPYKCPSCGQPRNWNPEKPTKCLNCKSTDTPMANEAPPIIVKGAENNWKMDITTSGVHWMMCDEEGNPIHEGLSKLMKESMAAEVGDFAVAPGQVYDCPPQERTVADSSSSCRFRIEEVDYDDDNLIQVIGDSVPVVNDKDQDQKTVSFHPTILTQYSLLQESKEKWADMIEDDELFFQEQAKSGAADLGALREGAMEYEGPETYASTLLRQLDTDKAKQFLLARLKGEPLKEGEETLLASAMTTFEKAREQHIKQQQAGAEFTQKLRPVAQSKSFWQDDVQKALESGDMCPMMPLGEIDPDETLLEITRKYVQAKGMIVQQQNPFHDYLISEMPEVERGSETVSRDAMLQLKWMMTKQAGVVKMFAGRWSLRPGLLILPKWATSRKLPDADLRYLERCTWPAGSDPNQYANNRNWSKLYSDDEMRRQWEQGQRPKPSNIRGIFFAIAEEKEDEVGIPIHHWVREVQTWDLPSLFAVHGRNYTAKQLWALWESLPLVQQASFRGDKTAARKKEKDTFLMAKAASRDLLDHMGLPQPKTKEQWHILLKGVGKFLAAKHFVTMTPPVVMELPIQESHDDIEHLRLRAVCDDTIHVPLDMLKEFPAIFEAFEAQGGSKIVTIHHYWRCNHVLYWTNVVTDQDLAWWLNTHKDNDGDCVPMSATTNVHTSSAAATGLAATAEGSSETSHRAANTNAPPITADNALCKAGKVWKKRNGYSKNDEVWWGKAECGLILGSVTPWEVVTKVHGETKGGYVCKYCQGFWKPGRGGGRFLQISDGEVTLQAIVDEPPGTLYAKWIRSRVEWYKRIAPKAPLTDKRPDLSLPAHRRVRMSEAVSQALWEVCLSNPDEAAMRHIEQLASRAVQREKNAL